MKAASFVREERRSSNAAEVELARVGDGGGHDLGPRGLGHELPGHDVGVVLHLRDEDLVAGAELGAEEALRHEIDALGGVADEDELAPVGGVDEPLELAPGRVVGRGGALAQLVHAAVDVGVVFLVEALVRLDHGRGLLGAGGTVEIDERPVVDLCPQDRELGADGRDVEMVGWGRAAHRRDGAHERSSPSVSLPGRRRSAARVA